VAALSFLSRMHEQKLFLDRFIDQIASWAATLVEQGTLPFRRIERERDLVTRLGRLRAPMVFWINRDSYMAGGVLFFPRPGTSVDYDQASAVSEALGLSSFASWEHDCIQVTRLLDDSFQSKRIWQLEKKDPTPADFNTGLRTLLDSLKMNAVTQAVPPGKLSTSVLLNLCLQTLDDLNAECDDAETAAQSILVLTRLLLALQADALPAGLQPERMDRAIRFHLGNLPADLESLKPLAEEHELPQLHNTKLHNLWHRLRQLLPAMPPGRIAELCRLLLDHFTINKIRLGGMNPAQELLTVNHPGCTEPALRCEIGQTEFLALTALHRHLADLPAIEQRTELWSPKPLPAHSSQLVRLAETKQPSAADRQRFTTLLRQSWPHRRIPLTAAVPTWIWEAIHLLGHLPDGGEWHADIPAKWLLSDDSQPFWEIICEEFTLLHLSLPAAERCLVQLKRGTVATATTLEGELCKERIPWLDLRKQSRRWIWLLLHLPAETFRLCRNGKLIPAGTLTRTEHLQLAIETYLGTSFCLETARLLKMEPVTIGHGSLVSDLIGHDFPFPTEAALQKLQDHLEQKREIPRDEILPILFSGRADQLKPPQANYGWGEGSGTKRASNRELNESLKQLIAENAPDFPEQYLYRFSSDQLKTIQIPPGLRFQEMFFGQILLESEEGTVDVSSQAEAACMLVASAMGLGNLRLPCSGGDCEEVYRRFRQDLHQLRHQLEVTATRQVGDKRKALRIVKSSWSRAALPPWETVLSEETLFSG